MASNNAKLNGMTNYYQISGYNKHVPVIQYCVAKTVASAKIDFYLNGGTKINYCLKITKSQYDENH